MNNTKKIKLNNVKLIFPNLFEKDKYNKYSATFVLNKDRHKETIEQILSTMDWVNSYKDSKSPPRLCFVDQDTIEDSYHPNSYILKASSKERPICVDQKIKQVPEAEQDIFTSGCVVNAYVVMYMYTKMNFGISADLITLQYVSPRKRDEDIEDIFGVVQADENEDNDNDNDLPF